MNPFLAGTLVTSAVYISSKLVQLDDSVFSPVMMGLFAVTCVVKIYMDISEDGK